MSVLQDELDIFGGPDTDLQTGEIELDSFDKTNILLAAEDRWGIDLGEENIERKAWQTPSTIAQMIWGLIDATA
jgi:acyl carrier protein